MHRVELAAGDWSIPACLASSFADRFFGNRRAPRGAAVVLRTRSVHSFGQREPIEVVGLDSEMRVVAIRTLQPNRIALILSARTIVELPEGASLPAVHDRIEIRHG
jgi:uncharacterized membrane protein (UPF0127 family)